jgi:flagellum-specific ATP synthase
MHPARLAELKRRVSHCELFRSVGKLRSAGGTLSAALSASVGELCDVAVSPSQFVPAEVIGFDGGTAKLLPFRALHGLRPDTEVVTRGRKLAAPVGEELLGRVIDALGEPQDNQGPLGSERFAPVVASAPAPMDRPRVAKPLATGQRVLDGLLTIGQGQRVAIFAGSGVGKSTLLGEIAKGAASDVNVIALIGERGREVRPFLEDCLGPAGLARSVVVVATSEQTAVMRVRAAQVAATIADDFRRQGAHVLFLLDSLTRLAMAQREIGLLLGEPPSSRGYTPSVFQLLANLLEQLGSSSQGSITGVLTVLVEGDDMDEPISDAVRSVVDGHIVLDRKLAEQGHYPAVDVPRSVSRVFTDLINAEQQTAARKLRDILAAYASAADLIRVGAYAKGSSPQVDRAVELLPAVKAFLKQNVNERSTLEQTRRALAKIAAAWPY